MAIELEPTAAQIAHRAQLEQRRAFAQAQNGGGSDRLGYEIIPDMSLVNHSKFKAALAAEAIKQAHRGDPSNLVKGLVKTFNSFS